MSLTQTQGQRLCELIHLLRKDWDIPGIAAAIRAVDIAPPAQIAAAALAYTANPDNRTPGGIPKPGPHWRFLEAGAHRAPTMCGAHPAHRAIACPECDQMPVASPEHIAAVRLRMRQQAAQHTPHQPQED